MKKKLFLFFALGFMAVAASAQSIQVVVDSRGNCIGRYEGTQGNKYIVGGQDDLTVPKAGHKVVTYSAAAGQGSVSYKYGVKGNVKVYSKPSTSSSVVASIVDPDGDYPEEYPCLGKVNGWYKVKVDGKVGYVKESLVDWGI